MEKIRVAAYCRVSTESDMQLNSFESQKLYFENHIAKKEEYVLQEIYADYGISGTNTEKREEFNRMIENAKKGYIDLILTKEVSRFARNVVDTLAITRQLKEIDVGVVFINDNINTLENDGELRLTIMSSLAQEESRKTSDRVKWGMKEGMKRGVVYTSPLIGYDLKDGQLYVNDMEAEIVRKIFRLYAYEQMGASTIARYLTEKAVKPPKRIKSWSGTTITRILKNEKFCGDLVQGKTKVKDYLSHKSIATEEQERIIIRNHHEAIVDRETWNIVQDKLNRVAEESSLLKRMSNSYWCTGLIRCGHCNKYYTVHSKKKKSGQFVAWRCVEAVRHGQLKLDNLGQEIGCDNKQINNIALEECIKFAIKTISDEAKEIQEDLTARIYKMNKELKTVEKDEELYNNKIKTNGVKQDKLYDLYFKDVIDEVEFSKRKKELDNELKEIENELQYLKDKIEKEKDGLTAVEKIINRITDIINENDYNNKVYERLVDEIVVFGSELHIYFKGLNEPIALKYKTEGRGANYKVHCSIVES